jgi:gp32-like DNA binding protein
LINGYKTDPDAIKREANRKDTKFHSFQSGRTVMRVLPPWSDRGVWFKPILEYVIKIGDEFKFMISPRDVGGYDPLFEYAEQLIASGDEKLVQRGKDIRPRRRFLVNALIIADQKGVTMREGPKIVNLPVRVKDDLVNLDTDVQAGYGDITNIERGFNVSVERQGENLNTRYSVRAHREQSSIIKTAREQGFDPDAWSLHDLDAVTKPASEHELAEVVARLKAIQAHNDASTESIVSPRVEPREPVASFTRQPEVGPPTGLGNLVGPPPETRG